MPEVLIKCPVTKRSLGTGFQVSKETFASIDYKDNKISSCPHCGQTHTWSKDDAFLASELPDAASGSSPVTGRSLFLRQGIAYQDTTVYLSGQAYQNCRFVRCTLMIDNAPFILQGSTFTECVVHLNVLLHDRTGIEDFRDLLNQIEMSMPQGGMNLTDLPSSGVNVWPFPHEPPSQPDGPK